MLYILNYSKPQWQIGWGSRGGGMQGGSTQLSSTNASHPPSIGEGWCLLQVVPTPLGRTLGHCSLVAAQDSSINQRDGAPQSEAASFSSTPP